MSDNLPNILFICSDQHTPRVTGCYGDRIVATPNIDALAAEGTRFTSFYCNDPICVPSRMSFMTGRYPFRAEVLGNQEVLDSRLPTLAHIAVRGGYHAVLSGKMHFYGPDQRHGFLEHLVGELGPLALLQGDHKYAPGLQHLGNCSRPEALRHTGPGNNPMFDYDAAVTAASVDWLHRWSQQSAAPPFFMVVGYLLPHCPYIAPRHLYDEYADKVKAPRISSGQLAKMHPHHHDYRRAIELDQIPIENQDRAAVTYYAMTDQLGQNIGRITDALKANRQWDNTIVVYFSDHGEMLGRHGRWHKESFREDSAGVPMIIRHPRQKTVPVAATPHSLVDLMPTLCQWLNVPPPPQLDGVSLVPSLSGELSAAKPVKCEVYTHWTMQQHGMSANRMVRQGPWRLCYYGAYDSFELFNLDDDPEELDDLANDPQYQPVIERLKPEIFADGWSRNIVKELNERLNARGERDNVKAYRDALRKSLAAFPRHVDSPDVWPGSGTTAATLDP